MAAFTEPWNTNDRAFYLMQNGATTLYFQMSLLDNDIEWLRENGYDVQVFDANNWKSELDFHNDISERLNFPDYYGSNLDALSDCLGDISTTKAGIVLVFVGFDRMIQIQYERARMILDIFERASRYKLLFGERFFCLVQTNKPDFRMDNLGGNSTNWNQKEFLNSSRGL